MIKKSWFEKLFYSLRARKREKEIEYYRFMTIYLMFMKKELTIKKED